MVSKGVDNIGCAYRLEEEEETEEDEEEDRMRRKCHCMAEATTGNTTHRACACTILTTLSATSEVILNFESFTTRTYESVPRSLCGMLEAVAPRTVTVVELFTQ